MKGYVALPVVFIIHDQLTFHLLNFG